MPTIEERVAYLEGQVSEQSHALLELRDAVRSVISRQFICVIGVQVTTLVAIAGALLARS